MSLVQENLTGGALRLQVGARINSRHQRLQIRLLMMTNTFMDNVDSVERKLGTVSDGCGKNKRYPIRA